MSKLRLKAVAVELHRLENFRSPERTSLVAFFWRTQVFYLYLGSFLVTAWLVQNYFRGITIFNIANSIILAAITYEAMPMDARDASDRQLSDLLKHNARLQETLSSLNEPDRELVKWRWYSVSFAHNHVYPLHPKKLGWAKCKNVYRDCTLVCQGIPKMKEHLQRRELFEKYIWWLEVSR